MREREQHHAPGVRAGAEVTRWMAVGVTLLVAACGGTSVVEGGGGGSGGSGGTTSTTSSTSSTSSTTSSTTNTGDCSDHLDCPDGVCIFATGQCVTACEDSCDSCGAGSVCNGCATSSCPVCADCMAACVPAEVGMCDEDDPCGAGEVCLFDQGHCAPTCGAGGCADPNMYCDSCATGSCCGCKNCVAACLPV